MQAVSSDGRWVACTKPMNARKTVLYTMVDLREGVRGVDNSLGNSLGYETREQCEAAIADFEAGLFELSKRRCPIPLHIEDVK